ncbi:protein of unknown function [Dethiosulfatibacter aminovorans DSM 17477]|uniref:DUF1893 domain-containing protein n=1 Tax=Dethiosulfatibacter aminovorans DSM 17477 TaxID=1121476 RepID=A0A1M6ITG5_9FIRM|nr:DUF1893 domain-containing protein [Dethiosulfatibacter aminovorans]SHJ37770.1 protein of unknown function [Dethiosulfatibacter aminovorans DSM 17477]
MNDLSLAREMLEKEGLTLAVVKDGECIFKSKERGIYPLYIAVRDIRREMCGASAADKVIGRGAAQLYEYANVKEVYSMLISEGTREIFEGSGIYFEAEKIVPKIMNREKTGMCPVETISYGSETIEEVLDKIEEFLNSINLL